MATQTSAPAPHQPSAPPQAYAFYIPPSMTFFVQYSDGTQVAFQPMPQVVLRPMPTTNGPPQAQAEGTIPLMFSGMQHMFAPSMNGLLHELFMRSQAESQGPPPTSQAYLEKLPIKVWCAAVKATEKHHECPICLSEYETNDEVISLPCGHLFHKECGMHWLKEHNVCPTCRYQLPTHQQEQAAASAHDDVPNVQATSSESSTVSSEPEQEPRCSERRSVRRQLSPRLSPERVTQRRRLGSDLSLPGAVEFSGSTADADEALDQLLEEEASRFVEEEAAQQRKNQEEISLDDIDIQELLHN